MGNDLLHPGIALYIHGWSPTQNQPGQNYATLMPGANQLEEMESYEQSLDLLFVHRTVQGGQQDFFPKQFKIAPFPCAP